MNYARVAIFALLAFALLAAPLAVEAQASTTIPRIGLLADATSWEPLRRTARPPSLAALFTKLSRSHFEGRVGGYSVRRLPATPRSLERLRAARNEEHLPWRDLS